MLINAIPRGASIATREFELRGRKPIDHIVLGRRLEATAIRVIDNECGERLLSDHLCGLAAQVCEPSAPGRERRPNAPKHESQEPDKAGGVG